MIPSTRTNRLQRIRADGDTEFTYAGQNAEVGADGVTARLFQATGDLAAFGFVNDPGERPPHTAGRPHDGKSHGSYPSTTMTSDSAQVLRISSAAAYSGE